MKLIFAGTPDFAATALQALIESEHEICAVYTQPDRAKGRGQHLSQSPVKQLALTHNIPVHQPKTLKDPLEQQQLKNLNADVMVVAAYGLLLPEAVLNAPKNGCINIHASILPRWRGAAPIQHAIMAGDPQTGISIMQMDKGLDTGPVLYTVTCAIHDTDTAKDIHDRLALLGAEAIIHTLSALPEAITQDDSHSTHAPKITKQDAKINWQHSAVDIHRMIRAFNPWPIAWCELDETNIRIWQANVLDQTSTHPPGTIVNTSIEGIDVATGEGILKLITLQLPNKKPLHVKDLLNAYAERFQTGQVLN